MRLRTDIIGNLQSLPQGTLKFIINEMCRNVLLIERDGKLLPLSDYYTILPALSYDASGLYIANATVGEAASYMVGINFYRFLNTTLLS